MHPRAEALGSANRELAGLKPSASTEPKIQWLWNRSNADI